MLINHQCIGGHASIPSPPHCEKLIDLMPNDIFCRIINPPPSAAFSSGRKSLQIKTKGCLVGVKVGVVGVKVGVVGGEVSQHRGEVDCLLGTLRLWGQPGGFGLGWKETFGTEQGSRTVSRFMVVCKRCDCL